MFMQNDDETVLTCVNFSANILVNNDKYIKKEQNVSHEDNTRSI